jgi:hypothetical protein
MKRILSTPIFWEGRKMKKHLEIIRGLGLIFLLFISFGIVAASDDSDDIHTVSVTIEQTSSSENGGDIVTNTYNKDFETTESTDVQVSGVISGDKASVTTNLDDTTTTEDDTTTTESNNPVGMPEFRIDESSEKFTEKLSAWISFMVDDVDPILSIDDFTLNAADIGIE